MDIMVVKVLLKAGETGAMTHLEFVLNSYVRRFNKPGGGRPKGSKSKKKEMPPLEGDDEAGGPPLPEDLDPTLPDAGEFDS